MTDVQSELGFSRCEVLFTINILTVIITYVTPAADFSSLWNDSNSFIWMWNKVALSSQETDWKLLQLASPQDNPNPNATYCILFWRANLLCTRGFWDEFNAALKIDSCEMKRFCKSDSESRADSLFRRN